MSNLEAGTMVQRVGLGVAEEDDEEHLKPSCYHNNMIYGYSNFQRNRMFN